jgi:methylated-DNA-protein-cysteine methyltransferase-like protein
MVCRIPEGKVATYGQIAKLIGYPKHARQIGFALSILDTNSKIPWHRVINSQGKISPRGIDGYDDYQRILLEDEKVVFNDKDCIDLKKYQWQPK